MNSRGNCLTCGKNKYLGGRKSCKPCSYPIGECVTCAHHGKIYVDGLCYCCYQHRQVNGYLNKIEKKFKPKTAYNHLLFNLYLTYIRRFRLSYYHLKQAKQLETILQKDSWQQISKWSDILELSRHYTLIHKNGKENGCAVRKIGHMLEELQVLSSKSRDLTERISSLTHRFEQSMQREIKDYTLWMADSGRTESTILCNLNAILKFKLWLEATYPQLSFSTVNEIKAIEHLEYLKKIDLSISVLRRSSQAIRRYYKWLVHKKKILHNPFECLDVPRPFAKINTLNESDLKALIKYIKHTDSDPESAMCLSLILFWGFTTDDILYAVIEEHGNELSIILNCRQRSFGRHYLNREQTLKIPDKPEWIENLKLRFLNQWRNHYKKVTKTYPIKPLLLPKNNHHVRPITSTTFIKRIKKATMKACGKEIPPRILRQTCGDLYARQGDGSLLAQLGWSPQFAFHYTWLPRKIFTCQAANKIHNN